MLKPAAHVPHMLCGDVAGLDGTRVAADLPSDLLDRCTLWVIGPSMAGAYLDLAGVEALQQLLGEVAAEMLAAGQAGAVAPSP
jgi:hypothetical protein